MEKTYKTIIIGAGPGGLIAGRNLNDFIILDKKSVIGEPVQCGEGISKKALSMHQINPDKNWISCKINIVERFVPNGKSFGTYHEDHSGYVINRIKFEQSLAEKIKDKIKLNTEVVSIKRSNDFWEVETSNGELFKSKYIIGADGANSIVRKMVFPEVKDKLEFYPGIEYFMETEKELKTDRVKMYFDNKKYNRGYAWIFTKSKNTANIGVCGKNIKMDAFDDFIENIVKKECGELKIIKNKSGFIPILKESFSAYKDNALLIGDAAGFADPFFKGGMNQSMLSGKTAAKCINEKRLKDYEKEINKFPFASKDVLEASEIFYSFENEVFNEIGNTISGKNFSYLKTPEGQKEIMSNPVLLKNIDELFKFFSVWERSSDYLW